MVPLPFWLLALTLVPTLAMAEEPTGLDGFAFGTRRSALMEPLFPRALPARVRRRAARSLQGPRVARAEYALKDLGHGDRSRCLFSPEDRFVAVVSLYLPEKPVSRAPAHTRPGPLCAARRRARGMKGEAARGHGRPARRTTPLTDPLRGQGGMPDREGEGKPPTHVAEAVSAAPARQR